MRNKVKTFLAFMAMDIKGHLTSSNWHESQVAVRGKSSVCKELWIF
jgi:hypothetical protein